MPNSVTDQCDCATSGRRNTGKMMQRSRVCNPFLYTDTHDYLKIIKANLCFDLSNLKLLKQAVAGCKCQIHFFCSLRMDCSHVSCSVYQQPHVVLPKRYYQIFKPCLITLWFSVLVTHISHWCRFSLSVIIQRYMTKVNINWDSFCILCFTG